MRNLWRWSVGLPEVELHGTRDVDFATQWSPEFERLMRNRLLVGAYRYGPIAKYGKPPYDRVPACLKRLRQYQQTGNTELLVDVANLCLLEYVEGRHPLKHWHATDDTEHVTGGHNETPIG